MNRRDFLVFAAGGAGLSAAGCRSASPSARTTSRNGRFLFVTQGRTGVMNADGTGFRLFDFAVPDQVTWQPGPALSDGRRLIFLSMEARRDGPGRPFEEYYTQTPTHLWLHDLETGALSEIATRDRLAVFYTPQLLISDERLLVQVVSNRVGQIFSMNLDGSDAREFTKAGEGLPYGLSLSPDGRRVAFHLAGPRGYEIWTSDADGSNRTRVAGNPEHLYFGTSWSPDGRWVLFQDCRDHDDPGHDWSDICIARPDGSELRLLTEGQAHWFGATYGNLERRGGGSNMPQWTRDGPILFARRLPGSHVAWQYRTGQPDLDHFNREFKPAEARGGSEVCRLDPRSGVVTRITASVPAVWDFRPAESPDGRSVLFCRAETGEMPAIWIADADGGNPRMLTTGLDGAGADHPRWLPGSR